MSTASPPAAVSSRSGKNSLSRREFLRLGSVFQGALPVGDGQSRTTSCLGGWNMLINASSEMKEEAWEVIRFMTSEESQKMWALEEGLLPAQKSLYDDREVIKALAFIA